MKKVPLSNGLVALVDDDDFDLVSDYKWHPNKDGYAQCNVPLGHGKRFVQSMHRLVLNNPKCLTVDHVNGDKLDNRKVNLRVCTHKQNMSNQGTRRNNKSGYKGVCWLPKPGVWSVQVQGKTVGKFRCKHAAAKHYNKIAIKVFGEFAKLNEVDGE